MSNAVIGALRVVLGLDTAQLDKGLKDAQGSLAKFSSSMKTAGIAAVAGLTTAFAGVGYAVKGALDQADKMGKMAQSVGIPVEELSKLKHAADLSGVGLDSLGTAMTRLSKNMSEGNEAFKIMGISLRNADGSLKETSTVLGDIADKFKGYADGANKTALAVSIFGKSGAEMIPMLNQGRAGLKEMGDEAERLGLVIDTRTTTAAENFNDNLTRIGRIGEGVANKIAGEVAPSLANLSEVMFKASQDAELLRLAAGGVSTAMNVIGTAALGSSAWMKDWALTAKMLAEAWEGVKNFDASSIAAAWTTYRDQARKMFAETEVLINQLWNPSQMAGMLSQSQRIAENAVMAGEAYLRMAGGAAPALAQVGADAKIAAEGLTAYNASVRNAAQLLTEAQTPYESYRAKLAEISMAQQQSGWSAETAAKLQEAAARKAGLAWDQQANSIMGSIGDIASTFGKENAKMAKASQIIGAVQALIATTVGAAESLKLGFPQGLAAAAAIAAKGAALIGTIKSAKVPGFQTGGSFRVAGSGGPDSQLMQFMATPGEMVDIRRPGDPGYDNRSGGSGSVPTVNLTIKGRSIDREQAREMIDALNEMAADGYKLNFV